MFDALDAQTLTLPAEDTWGQIIDRNWWLPRWLDRILPTIHVEPTRHGGAGDRRRVSSSERVPAGDR